MIMLAGNTAGECELSQTQIMDQETITGAPGNDSEADTSSGITTEAKLANSFVERVEEQLENAAKSTKWSES